MDFCRDLCLNFTISLNTPEEIQRWREDRRKNYPKLSKDKEAKKTEFKKPQFNQRGFNRRNGPSNHERSRENDLRSNSNYRGSGNRRGWGRQRGRGRGGPRTGAWNENHTKTQQQSNEQLCPLADTCVSEPRNGGFVHGKMVSNNTFVPPAIHSHAVIPSSNPHKSVIVNTVQKSNVLSSLHSLASAYASSEDGGSSEEEGEIIEESDDRRTKTVAPESQDEPSHFDIVSSCVRDVIDEVVQRVGCLNTGNHMSSSVSAANGLTSETKSSCKRPPEPTQSANGPTTSKKAKVNNNSGSSRNKGPARPPCRRHKLTLFEKLLLEDVKREEEKIVGVIEALVTRNFLC